MLCVMGLCYRSHGDACAGLTLVLVACLLVDDDGGFWLLVFCHACGVCWMAMRTLLRERCNVQPRSVDRSMSLGTVVVRGLVVAALKVICDDH